LPSLRGLARAGCLSHLNVCPVLLVPTKGTGNFLVFKKLPVPLQPTANQ
jgi:hypothetical protein